LSDAKVNKTDSDGDRFEWFEQTITQDVISYATPATFNEPFECRFHMSFEASTPEKSERYA